MAMPLLESAQKLGPAFIRVAMPSHAPLDAATPSHDDADADAQADAFLLADAGAHRPLVELCERQRRCRYTRRA